MPTTVNATNGLTAVATYVNSITDNWISNLILIAIYVIVLIGYYKARDDFAGAMAVSGYLTFVVALLFWVGGFVTGWALAMAIGISIIGTFFLLLDNGNPQ